MDGVTVPIIGLCGAMGSGKTTIAREIARIAKENRREPVILPLAAVLKGMLRSAGVPEMVLYGSQARKEEPRPELGGKTARYAMQTLGTEWGRNCMGKDIWINLWAAQARDATAIGQIVIADDVRFENEVSRIKRMGGCVAFVRHYSSVEEATASHASENVGSLASICTNVIPSGDHRQKTIDEIAKVFADFKPVPASI